MAKFKLSSIENTNFDTPQEMYDDYKNRTIANIFDYQSDMIDSYLKEENTTDIALELPTGTGKTLVGLLIGEFRRRKYRERILYLCPNNQLVNQTVEHSNKDYGIKATAFVGKAIDYLPKARAEYYHADTIAVASYSALFNSNPFFADADIIIFDDAHSGEGFVASNWTVTVDRQKDVQLYFTLADFFHTYLDEDLYEKMLNTTGMPDYTWVDMVPNIRIVEHYQQLSKIFNEYISNNPNSQVRYAWSMVKDHLSACNIFISYSEMIIRPFIPPTMIFSAFRKAKQRIYMSATLGKSGELERAFGVPEIKKLPMVKDWVNKTIGRRFFMFFPELKSKVTILNIIDRVNRSLIIVNDGEVQNQFQSLIENITDKKVFTAKDIEASKKNFITSDQAVAIVANRFDGIDFPGDECRLEILFDLQNATHIQEKFLITRMASTVLFSERIRARLVQALGRCTRGNTDYAAVCIVGDDLMNMLISPKQNEQFNPELQAELEFGFENSVGYNSLEDYLELLNTFLEHSNEWNDAEKDIISRRDRIISQRAMLDEEPFIQLNQAGKYEIQAQYNIWQEAFSEALQNIEKVCGFLRHDALKGYLGFWYYVAAYCAYNLFCQGDETYKAVYSNYLRQASKTTLSIKWFNKLVEIEKKEASINDRWIDCVLERIESEVAHAKSRHPNIKSIYDELDQLVSSIENAGDAEFEKAHEKLGKWMGYRTTNPQGDSEPDPVWIINAECCIVSEDKIYKKEDKAIPTRHVRQAAGHCNWIKSHHEKLQIWENVKSICVFLTDAQTIEESAVVQADDIYYLNRKEFSEWAKRCIEVLKELIISFSNIGDVVWRDKAVQLMTSKKLMPADYIEKIKSRPLKKLPIKASSKQPLE